MNKKLMFIGLSALTMQVYSAIIDHSPCLREGQACTVTTTYRGGMSDITQGTCISGQCRIPAVVMIHNESDEQAGWNIICSGAGDRVTVMPTERQWINVAPQQVLVCKPCSGFGLCSKKKSISVSPVSDSGFSWDGQKWTQLGQRIVD